MKRTLFSLILAFVIFLFNSCEQIQPLTESEISVIFNKNADESTGSMNHIMAKEGFIVTLPNNEYIRLGHSFTSWNTASDGNGTTYDIGANYTMGSSDSTLYAQWSINPTYEITFNTNGAIGSIINQNIVQGISAALSPLEYYLSDNIFVEWNTEADGSGISYSNGEEYTMGSSDIFLYAQWETASHYFRTSWDVIDVLRFPLYGDGNYCFTIEWGDGSIERITEVSDAYFIEHTYSTSGIYEVKIYGTCEGFGYQNEFKGNNGAGTLIDVVEWGQVSLHSQGYQFSRCQDLVSFSASDTLDTSNITNMTYMFSGEWNTPVPFNGDLSDWDTSNVTNMTSMFSCTSAFNQDISNWFTSSVTDMSRMFQKAVAFNQDIGNWITSNVIHMDGMFGYTLVFNQDISFNEVEGSWNTSNVKTMGGMFSSADSFNQNIGNWNTSNVGDMHSMFSNTVVFNQYIGDWATSNVYFMSGMFYSADAFNQDLSSWDTSNVRQTQQMFQNASSFNCGGIDIATWNWNLANVQNKDNMFAGSLLDGAEPSWY